LDPDATPGVKLLRLFRKLMLDGRRHFQVILAKELECSPQSIIRMVGEIGAVVGDRLESGLENRRRWYQIKTISRSALGMDYEELRYLSICRDLAVNILPERVLSRVDATILNLSMLMADQGFASREKLRHPQFRFFSKGRIDYSPHFRTIELFKKAAEERQICQVTYKASGQEKSREILFAPGEIVCMSGALYAVGASVKDNCSEIHHLTNFAIHRVIEAVETGRYYFFDIPEAGQNVFGLPWHEPKSFRIKFAPGKASDYVRERSWADNQSIRNSEDGGVILELTTRSELELMAWVRSFGEEARLLEGQPEKA
jgi:hypothetical protein